jgi:hypothetical protein
VIGAGPLPPWLQSPEERSHRPDALQESTPLGFEISEEHEISAESVLTYKTRKRLHNFQ